MTGATTERARPPAEPDRRFSAFVVDRLVAWVVEVPVAYLAARHLIARDHPVVGVVLIAGAVLAVGGTLTLVLGRTGTSPGRALTGLRLVDARTGAPVGARRAVERQLLVWLATLPTFGLGVAALAWTALTDPSGRRHGWHDRLVGSEVVGVRAPRLDPSVDEEPDAGLVVNLTALRLVPAPAPTPVPVRSPAPHVAVLPPPAPAAQPGRWRVVFDTGESVVVEGPVLLGRAPEARPGEPVRHLVPLASSDLSLSKTHARLRLGEGGVLEVVDLGSTNGSTLLRRGAVRDLPTGRPTTLVDGDLVRFGDREMRVTGESRPGGAPTIR